MEGVHNLGNPIAADSLDVRSSNTHNSETYLQRKGSGKMQFCNRHFVISGVLSHPHPTPTKIIVAVVYSSLVDTANRALSKAA